MTCYIDRLNSISVGSNDNHHLAAYFAKLGGGEDFLRYNFCDKSGVKAFRLPAGI